MVGSNIIFLGSGEEVVGIGMKKFYIVYFFLFFVYWWILMIVVVYEKESVFLLDLEFDFWRYLYFVVDICF